MREKYSTKKGNKASGLVEPSAIEESVQEESWKEELSLEPVPVIQEGDNYGLITLYEPDEPNDANVDIVFIHGLIGNSFTTWLHKDSRVHWPSQLLKNDVPQARILNFGYDASVASFWGGTSQNRLAVSRGLVGFEC